MSSLDQISLEIGKLIAGQESLLKRAETHDRRLSDMRDALDDYQAQVVPLVDDVADMKPHVEHYRSIRGRVAYIGTLLLTFAGAVGGAVSDWLLKKFGS